MPAVLILGDSIWAGYPTGYGPRAALAAGLGPSYSFVGSQTTRWNQAANGGKGAYTTDGVLRHEAYGGWSVADFLRASTSDTRVSRAYSWVRDSRPDIVVIELGNNDTGEMGLSSDAFLARYNQLLADVRRAAPASMIYALSLPAATGGRLKAFSDALKTVGSDAAFVDASGTLNAEITSKGFASVMRDGHPNERGAVLIANGLLSRMGGIAQPVPAAGGTTQPQPPPPPSTIGKLSGGETPTSEIDKKRGPFSWDTYPNMATIVVDQDRVVWMPLLSGAEKAYQDRMSAPFDGLIDKYAIEFGVPRAWIKGVIYAESRFNPKAMAADGGVGLMQLTAPSLKAGHTDLQLQDPDLNLSIGVKFLGSLVDKIGRRLPEVASGYNCGIGSNGFVHFAQYYSRTSTLTPWSLCSSLGYIGRVVSAANSAALDMAADGSSGGGGRPPPPPRNADSGDDGGLVMAGLGILGAILLSRG